MGRRAAGCTQARDALGAEARRLLRIQEQRRLEIAIARRHVIQQDVHLAWLTGLRDKETHRHHVPQHEQNDIGRVGRVVEVGKELLNALGMKAQERGQILGFRSDLQQSKVGPRSRHLDQVVKINQHDQGVEHRHRVGVNQHAVDRKDRGADQVDESQAQLAEWEAGTLIQNAMPSLSADDREFIMTGITPEEWDATFGDSEE